MHQVSLETICPLKAFQLHYCPDNNPKSMVKHFIFLHKFSVVWRRMMPRDSVNVLDMDIGYVLIVFRCVCFPSEGCWLFNEYRIVMNSIFVAGNNSLPAKKTRPVKDDFPRRVRMGRKSTETMIQKTTHKQHKSTKCWKQMGGGYWPTNRRCYL